MSNPILATKLYIPPPRSKAIIRPRLLKKLNEGIQGKLSLISAPAGFGKTTLLTTWISRCEHPVAWLSLSTGDQDITHFLTYLVAALQRIKSDLGTGVLALLQSPRPPSSEVLLTTLLNELATIPDRFILVLDDYHLIDAKTIDESLIFILNNLPSQMHLVIATREDPHLPLARLRARRQLTELRARDLRFSAAEGAEFLRQGMGLTLSTNDIAALETRTEGWITGLQLAAISMQGHPDLTKFIQSFTGSHRFVLDYLVEEVLQQQPDQIQTFLLQTSILERLCAASCAALAGIDDVSSQETLEYLERANLLIVPLDDHRQWYRYHHLFGEVLRARLVKKTPDQVSNLHRRASDWYEQQSFRSDAISHALAAKDFERAADLIELSGQITDRIFQPPTWLDWVKALPEDLIPKRPVLSVAYGWELLGRGEMEAAETHFHHAEHWLDFINRQSDQTDILSREMVVVDKAEFAFLPANLAAARAYQAQALGDLSATVRYAQQSLDLYPEDNHIRRGVPAALLGMTYWATGNLETAFKLLDEVMHNFRRVGNMIFALSGTYGLADIKIAQGQLGEALHIYEQALHLALAQGPPMIQGTADIYLGLSGLSHELGNREAAQEYLLQSEALGEAAALPDWPYRLHLVKARIKEAEGDFDGALTLLEAAEILYYRSPIPNLQPLGALKAGLWLKQGKRQKALAWVREQGLSLDDPLSYLREFEHLMLIRVVLAQYQISGENEIMLATLAFLMRLRTAAEAGKRLGI